MMRSIIPSLGNGFGEHYVAMNLVLHMHSIPTPTPNSLKLNACGSEISFSRWCHLHGLISEDVLPGGVPPQAGQQRQQLLPVRQ